MSATTNVKYTPDDLLAMPDGKSYELVDGCLVEHSPNTVRRPDVSFIRLGRLPREELPKGHCTLAPDLPVKVVSPNELVYELDQKIGEYLEAGVRLVWVVHPDARTVEIHRPDSPGTILRENDELSGEDVLPGFRCAVRDLFVPVVAGDPK